MVVAIGPSDSIVASGELGSSSDCMIAGIARRRTSASSPRMAPRFQAQSRTTSVGVNVTFFAAIMVIVSSLSPRAVCSRPLAPASMARRASASVPTCTVVLIRRLFASAMAARNTSSFSFGSCSSGKAGLQHELHEVDTTTVEFGDRGARFIRRFHLPRQHVRKARHEAKHRRGMSAASGHRRTGVERARRVPLASTPTSIDSFSIAATSSVSDTTDVTPAASVGAVVVRQAIVGLLDRRAADAAGTAPVHVRIEQAGNQEAAAHVLHRRAFGHRHAVVVQRHFRDAVIANHHAGVGDAAAEPIEHGGAAQHEDLAGAPRLDRCGACRASRPS